MYKLSDNKLIEQPGMEKPKIEMCKCGKNPATELHTCPYREDINNDSESLCDCCDECVHECAMDI